MIIQKLKKSIPNANNLFTSLTGHGKYHFLEWGIIDPDKLTYWFWSKGQNNKGHL